MPFQFRERRNLLVRLSVFLILLVLLPPSARSNADTEEMAETETDQPGGNTFIPFPFYFYMPETRSGGGFALSYFTRPDDGHADSRPSSYGLVFIFTERKQYSTALGCERYWQDEKYFFAGEFVLSKFPTTYFGIGNDTDRDVSEDYTPKGYGLFLRGDRKIAEGLRTGPRLDYYNEEIVAVEDGGWFDSGGPTGSEGGRLVNLGWALCWDDRDNVSYPSSGRNHEFSVTFSDDVLGSDFCYFRQSLDLRRYRTVGKGQVLALRGLLTHTSGHPPLQTLSKLGGQDLLRGFYEGRFRERNLWALQAEYRVGYWKRTGLALFTGIGDVAHSPGDFRIDEAKAIYGLGLRVLISAKEKINLRADFGFTDEGYNNMYLSMGEAF